MGAESGLTVSMDVSISRNLKDGVFVAMIPRRLSNAFS
jgi:hypothetical protein